MELIERDDFLASLHNGFKKVAAGEGHSFFIIGEAGIGKTSLVKSFLKQVEDDCIEYVGACDSLFTPRPLAPLYDLALQIEEEWTDKIASISSRAEVFTKFLQQLTNKHRPVVLVFEDIHWADEATLDFVKFFARRISGSRCMFILTYRDDEITQQHPLRNVLGNLSPDIFTRMQLTPLSKQSVYKLADENGKGYDAENVYSISSGNPFYVNEILASYSAGVPDNIKDSILSVYSRQEEATKNAWQLLSVVPEGLELDCINTINSLWGDAIGDSITKKILIIKNDKIFFKHELYRITIESSLSPFKRIALNKKLLELFLESFEEKEEIEKIVHHAKNANEYDLVVRYAPIAAKQAICVGAHIEACRLYLSAIEYYQGEDTDILIQFYESYAYECYLTNQIKEAIFYTGKALNLWKKKNDTEKMGNCMRFLSRLWWFDGNGKQAENFARQATEVLDAQPSSRAKAMAYSNMSQLKMLADQDDECIFWGEKAIAIAKELNDEETLSHALNNVGSVQMKMLATLSKGTTLLQESLEIAKKNSYHEHVARAYTNLGSNAVTVKDYSFAKKILDEGIHYCEERDLDSWTSYMSSWKARLNLEIGNWDEAYNAANNILKNENQPPVTKIYALVVAATVRMRRGDLDALALLLEAKIMGFKIMELQSIIPALSALLEYEWITGKTQIETEALDRTVEMIGHSSIIFESNEFAFWLKKARKQKMQLKEIYEGYEVSNVKMAQKAAVLWEKLGFPYQQALALSEGNEDDKRSALSIFQQLGADAVYEKIKMEMRSSGIKKIPRGIRESTKANPAQLTNREIDVLQLLKSGVQNKEIAESLFISPKTVDHHISSILFKLDVNSRSKAVTEAARLGILK